MELWDGYKEDGSLGERDLVRGEPIPKGYYHLVSEVLVKHIDGSYLVMQRDWNKAGHPGLYESSAGGSAIKGESALFAAKRELQEETGIQADNLELLYRHQTINTIFCGYLYITDCNKKSIKLQAGETITYHWLEEPAFLKFTESEQFIPSHRERLSNFIKSIQ